MIGKINNILDVVSYILSFIANVLLFPIKVIIVIVVLFWEIIKYAFGVTSLFKFVPKKNHYRNKLGLQILKD